MCPSLQAVAGADFSPRCLVRFVFPCNFPISSSYPRVGRCSSKEKDESHSFLFPLDSQPWDINQPVCAGSWSFIAQALHILLREKWEDGARSISPRSGFGEGAGSRAHPRAGIQGFHPWRLLGGETETTQDKTKRPRAEKHNQIFFPSPLLAMGQPPMTRRPGEIQPGACPGKSLLHPHQRRKKHPYVAQPSPGH